jgi:hypothetical protein
MRGGQTVDGLTTRDFLIRQRDQLLAAAAHLNGNGLQRVSLEAQLGGLAVIGTADVLDLARGPFLEIVDRMHESILA